MKVFIDRILSNDLIFIKIIWFFVSYWDVWKKREKKFKGDSKIFSKVSYIGFIYVVN